MKERFYLKEWRKRRHLSQTELSKIANVTQGTISAIEVEPEAVRHEATVRDLARALGCEPEDLKRAPPERLPPAEKGTFDLRAWLNDPNAELTEGVKPTDAQKKIIEAVFWEIYNREQGKK